MTPEYDSNQGGAFGHSTSYVVILSGTHVTGKDTLSLEISQRLGCPWLRGEMAHTSANFGARSQSTKGYDFAEVFERIWITKLRRMGLEKPSHSQTILGGPGASSMRVEYLALISCYAMQGQVRDAMRKAMLANGMIPIFVILQISETVLSGRTLGAEVPDLAMKIMEIKIADIQRPSESEKDVILVDSTKDLDALFTEIVESIKHKVPNRSLDNTVYVSSAD